MAARKLSYWEKRALNRMFDYMESAEAKAEQLNDLYYRGSRYLSMSAQDIFEKFQTKHNLTEKEARELMKKLVEDKKDPTSFDDFLEKYKTSSNAKDKEEILAKLEAPAYRARIERLESLQKQIDQVMQYVYQQEKTLTTEHYVDLAYNAYYRSIFDIQKETGLGFEFGFIDTKLIDRIINSQWEGANYSQRIWNNTTKLAEQLKKELLINMVVGRSERDAAQVIDEQFQSGYKRARRLIRTESNYVSTQVEMEALEECEIEYYRFSATLDLVTSEVCRKLDLKRFKVKDRKPGINCPPMHPWCRSTIIGDLTEEELARLTRRARDPVTGKSITVPRNMSYEQWYEKYVKDNREALLAEKKVKNRFSDRAQLERYREVVSNTPKTLDDFQEIKYNSNKDSYQKLVSDYRNTRQENWQNEVLERSRSLEGFKSIESPSQIPEWLRKQSENWTDDEKKALNYYTSHNFTKINKYLRGREDAGPGIKQKITDISNAIEKAEVKENIGVYRGTSFGNLINGEALKKLPIEQWRGQVLSDKAFSSTSLFQDTAFSREISMHIMLPKDSRGAYLYELSEFKSEYEVLLQKGGKLRVVNAESRNGKYFVEAIWKGE